MKYKYKIMFTPTNFIPRGNDQMVTQSVINYDDVRLFWYWKQIEILKLQILI